MISMRSSSARSMVSVVLAVVMNKTPERSNGASRKWSRKWSFCAGSSASSSAEEGSPAQVAGEPCPPRRAKTRDPSPRTGGWRRSAVPAWRDVGAPVAADLGLVVHSRPGDICVNLRPRARATERAMEVLPTPGGPTRQKDGALEGRPCALPRPGIPAACP